MNLLELDHALRKLRLSGMADVLETRLRQAQSDWKRTWKTVPEGTSKTVPPLTGRSGKRG